MSSSDFKRVSLSEVSINNKGNYGIGVSAVDYSDELYTYLRITDIAEDGTLIKSDLKSVDDPEAEKYLLKSNDIVFARTGNSTGKSYFYDESDGPLVYAGFLIKFSLDENLINPKFMKYYVLSEEYKNWVKGACTGSTRPNINAKMYGEMEFNLPSREQQDFLVKILSLLDEKIKINKKINHNLEKIIQIFFSHTFKNFKDINKKDLKESELGIIPNNWKICKLKDIVIKNKTKIKEFNKWKNELLIDLSLMPKFSISITNFDKGEKLSSNIYKLNKFDILFGSIRPYFGKAAFSPIDGVVAGTILSYKPKNEIYYSYLLALNCSKTFINYTVSVSKGTKMPSIRWNDFVNYNIIIPKDESIIEEFNNKILPMVHIIQKNIEEIILLTKLRDTLLPKLMSGEIDVSKYKIMS